MCRVVEISKGAGLVVETGNLFRPTEKLTKIEAITFALRASHIIEGPQTTEQILKIAIDAKLIPSEVGFNSNDIAVRGEFFYYLVQSIEAAKVPDLCTIAPDLCTVSTSCENLQGSQNCLQQNGCYYNEKTSKCTSEALKCEDMSDAQDDIFTKGMIW